MNVYFRVEGNKYNKFKKYTEKNIEPKIPSTWSSYYNSGGGSSEILYSNFTFKGPSDDEEKVIKSIKKFYNGYDCTVKKINKN